MVYKQPYSAFLIIQRYGHYPLKIVQATKDRRKL